MYTPIPKIELVIGREYTACILECIKNAKSDIKILMFEWKWYKEDFSSDASRINQAILQAIRRGVKVRAFINSGVQAEYLKSVGIETQAIKKRTLMHSKTIVFDNKTVLIGSHNLTENAMTSNIETSVCIDDDALAQKIETYFDNLWQ